ncbi:MAG: 50S ribosomal protein L19e [Candidatus Micrarchaeota archaeon]
MATHTIRRLAASIMGAGENRIWFDPASASRISEALTRDDVRRLIDEGLIRAEPARGVSRFRGRDRAEGKRVGRRKGHGSRKGTAHARSNPKDAWMAKARSQRKLLRNLRADGRLDPASFRKAYLLVKGNTFRGKAALTGYLKENNLVTGADKPKSAPAPKAVQARPAQKVRSAQTAKADSKPKSG